MKRILLTTIAAVFFLVPIATAQPGMGFGPGCGNCDGSGPGHGSGFGHGMRGGHHGFGMGIMACKDDLNLTDEQIEKIKAVNLDHQAEMIDFRAELAKLQLNKQSNMMSDNPDRDQAISLTRQINEVRGRISLAQVSHRFAVRDILTSEQIEKMKDCRMGKRGKWMRGDNDDDRPGRGFRRKG